MMNFRQQDIQKIQSATKSWITQGYLLKPNEILLHRDPAEGGLGVVHAASRCQANLIKTFISQGDPRSQHSNSYLTTLFRTFVSQELPEDTIKKPSYFTGSFFTTIREVWEERGAPLHHHQGVAEDPLGEGHHPCAGPARHTGLDRN